MYLTNVITGKRYIKKLVEDKIVDGWDDPRLVTIAALRRRGYTPESIRRFVELAGVSKADNSIDSAMLEYCLREDLKLKKSRVMAILDPVKLVIDNYPEGQIEELDAPNNMENGGTWFQERFHLAENFTSNARTLWKNHRRNRLPSLPGQ